jgi:hypothetical protein
MAKREFPDRIPYEDDDYQREDYDCQIFPQQDSLSGDFSSRIPALLSRVFGLVKLLLAVLILPFVYSAVVSFLSELGLVNGAARQIFWNGVLVFLGVHLFLWEPAVIYKKGHKLLEVAVSFFKPMVNVAPFLLPIYTILCFVLYGVLSIWISAPWLLEQALFWIGFTLALHLVFSAKSIRAKKGDFLKANYIFGISFIVILNIALVAFGFCMMFKEFSFVNFCTVLFSVAQDVFHSVFKQLFLF